jgi:predicted aldo/keto reductase-like oxidoreductase
MSVTTRPFGASGEPVSILGVGGGHIGSSRLSAREAVHLVQYAVDRGITFMDNAWEYNEGRSESLMGEALQGRRDQVFLMTKVCARDRAGAERDLNDSLRRLRTDCIDLWQFHEINYGNDREWIFAAGGAAEAARAALEAGKVRYVGFTGHKDPQYLLAMMEQDFPWASVQMPVNVLDVSYRSFVSGVIPRAAARGMAVIGMKSLGGAGQLVLRAGIAVEDCLRFALSQPITTLVCGMESTADVDQNLRVARDFRPMSDAEQQTLAARTRAVAGDGRYEWYKTTQHFDSTTHRYQHGFPDFGR